MSYEGKKMDKLLSKILFKIKPSQKGHEEEKKFAQSLIEKIQAIKGEHIEAMLAGSIARNTHLAHDKDIDIFVLFPEKMERKAFEKQALAIAKKISPKTKWEEVYTEHPYCRGLIGKYWVEIIPSYKIESTALMKSAVDRSPFHTTYLEEKLSEKQKDEIRLLRQFLKGINAYGAEIKTESFPGYVAELLVLNYGTFVDALKGAGSWKKHEVIDIEKQVAENDAKKMFENPLIVIDPVDKSRNVAAALSLTQMARFCMAAREFIKRPSEKFFFPTKEKIAPAKKAKSMVENEGLIVIEIGYPKTVSDVAWGQLKRFSKRLQNELEQKEFSVLRKEVFTDEEKYMTVVFDLKANFLEKVKKRVGPEVFDEKNCENFLAAHKKTLSGPRIEDGRVVVEIERTDWDAKKYLEKLLAKTRKEEKDPLKGALKKRAKILSPKEILLKYAKDKEFQGFFSAYLLGKESFL